MQATDQPVSSKPLAAPIACEVLRVFQVAGQFIPCILTRGCGDSVNQLASPLEAQLTL